MIYITLKREVNIHIYTSTAIVFCSTLIHPLSASVLRSNLLTIVAQLVRCFEKNISIFLYKYIISHSNTV